MLGDVLMLAAALWLGYACLNSLITAEISFGRSSRTIRLADDSGWFWLRVGRDSCKNPQKRG